MSFKAPTVQHLLQANKAIKKLKFEPHQLTFPVLDPELRLVVYSDASHANLPDGVSSAGGHLILLVGCDEKSCILTWSCNKIRRVVKSTSAAESLALLEGLEDAIYIQTILKELLQQQIPIDANIDSKNLHNVIHSTKPVTEKRLRIDVAAIKQMVEKKEVNQVKWVPTQLQIADCLSKRGASCSNMMRIIETGCLT